VEKLGDDTESRKKPFRFNAQTPDMWAYYAKPITDVKGFASQYGLIRTLTGSTPKSRWQELFWPLVSCRQTLGLAGLYAIVSRATDF